MFEQWTTTVENGKMVSPPPYPYLLVQKRKEAVVTTGGQEAYTHLLVRVWNLLFFVITMVALFGFAAVCIASGALSFRGGWVAVVFTLFVAIVPLVLQLSELRAWFANNDTRQTWMSKS